MKRSKGYLHGFTPEEQDRLRRQARIIENLVHEHRLPFQRSRRLLEIGCGVGAQTEILLRHFPELHVTGLDASQTKGKSARLFPFGLAPALKTLLETQWRARDGVYVFHHNGKRIGDFRRAWATACKRAGLPGMLVHDLRRTAARDFRRQGVSEGEIMKLCGWKTRSMFDRYNIIDEADLAQAVAKRFNDQGAAKEPAPTLPPKSLSCSPVSSRP